MARPPERRQHGMLEIVGDRYLVLARRGDVVIAIRRVATDELAERPLDNRALAGESRVVGSEGD